MNGTSTRRSLGRETRRLVEAGTADEGEWTREPPDRTAPSGRPVGSGAARQRYRAAPIDRRRFRRPSERGTGAESGWHRGRLDLSSRQGRKVVLILRRPAWPHDDKPTQPDRGQAPGGQRRHHAAARHARRGPGDAVGAFLRWTTAARLPARVGRGRRARRALLLPGRRCRGGRWRCAGRRAHRRSAASTEDVFHAGLPTRRWVADPIDAIRPSCPAAGWRRSRTCRASPAARSARWPMTPSASSSRGPAARRRSRRRAHSGLPGDGPGPRLRPPDPHAARDRLATERAGRPRGPIRGSRNGRSSRRSSGPPDRPPPSRHRPQRPPQRRWLEARRARKARSRPASAAMPTTAAVVRAKEPSRPARRSRSCSPAASRLTLPRRR